MVTSSQGVANSKSGRHLRGQASLCAKTIEAPTYGQYYVYSSGPRLSHADRPKTRAPSRKKSAVKECHARHAANIGTKGAHEFYNMMWDPSVYRGNTYKTFETGELDRFRKKGKQDEVLVKKRKYHKQHYKLGGVEKSDLASTEERTERVGFEDMGLQTEMFLEEITMEVGKKDMCTQSDAMEERVVERIIKPFMIGTSQQCQTDPTLSFDFDQNVKPLQKAFSKKLVEQALFETTEEAELEMLRREKRAHMQLQREEQDKHRRLVYAQRTVEEARAVALQNQQRDAKLEEEAESRLGASMFAAGSVAGMVPIAFSIMKIEGYMSETGSQDICNMLMPWMDCEVAAYYSKQNKMSRILLDELLHKVTTEREAEVALGIMNKLQPQILLDAPSNETLSFPVNHLGEFAFSNTSLLSDFGNIDGEEPGTTHIVPSDSDWKKSY
ncbi:unnamed protein product [Orchesella dallaii]|uniref:Radial spoke head protein 3 n=1 Tax=Orchesella dallaii TaxID=48710 RepID=A0ABP1SAK9_9HEXA